MKYRALKKRIYIGLSISVGMMGMRMYAAVCDYHPQDSSDTTIVFNCNNATVPADDININTTSQAPRYEGNLGNCQQTGEVSEGSGWYIYECSTAQAAQNASNTPDAAGTDSTIDNQTAGQNYPCTFSPSQFFACEGKASSLDEDRPVSGDSATIKAYLMKNTSLDTTWLDRWQDDYKRIRDATEITCQYLAKGDDSEGLEKFMEESLARRFKLDYSSNFIYQCVNQEILNKEKKDSDDAKAVEARINTLNKQDYEKAVAQDEAQDAARLAHIQAADAQVAAETAALPTCQPGEMGTSCLVG